nr:hypothetical protein CFP56_41434 [Quercus suber]
MDTMNSKDSLAMPCVVSLLAERSRTQMVEEDETKVRTAVVAMSGALQRLHPLSSQGKKCDPSDSRCSWYLSSEWSTNKALLLNKDTTGHSKPSISRVNDTWDGTLRERRSLHFFAVSTGPELAGHFDRDFWRDALLQCTRVDPAIKHIVAALGAMHEHQLRRRACRYNAETDAVHAFALRQCNKTIRALIVPFTRLQGQDHMRALTASILFTCFAAMCGDLPAAVSHMLHARPLMMIAKARQADAVHPPKAGYPVSVHMLKPLIVHAEIEIADQPQDDAPGVLDPKGEVTINSESEARISLERSIAQMSKLVFANLAGKPFVRESVMAIEAKKVEYKAWLERWAKAMEDHLDRARFSLDTTTLQAFRILKAHQLTSWIYTSVSYWDGEAGWTRYTPQFEQVINLLEEVIDDLPKRSTTALPPQMPFISTKMGMTAPLYITATRCVDARIAHRARNSLSILRHYDGSHSEWRISFIERSLCANTGRVYQPVVPDDEATMNHISTSTGHG